MSLKPFSCSSLGQFFQHVLTVVDAPNEHHQNSQLHKQKILMNKKNLVSNKILSLP